MITFFGGRSFDELKAYQDASEMLGESDDPVRRYGAWTCYLCGKGPDDAHAAAVCNSETSTEARNVLRIPTNLKPVIIPLPDGSKVAFVLCDPCGMLINAIVQKSVHPQTGSERKGHHADGNPD